MITAYEVSKNPGAVQGLGHDRGSRYLSGVSAVLGIAWSAPMTP